MSGAEIKVTRELRAATVSPVQMTLSDGRVVPGLIIHVNPVPLPPLGEIVVLAPLPRQSALEIGETLIAYAKLMPHDDGATQGGGVA